MAALTLFVRGLPASATSGRLAEVFSEIGPLKHCFVVTEKGGDECRGFGYVTFAMEEDSQRAMKEIKDYDGRKISVVVAKRKPNDQKKGALEDQTPIEKKAKGLRNYQKKARLIVRNLSFKCSEEDLRRVFSEFGTVLDVNIPLKPDGKMQGFAFIQLKNVLQAGKALKAINLKEIKGRQVVIDWAIAKDKYVSTLPRSSSGNAKQSEGLKQAEEDSEDEDEEVVEKPGKTEVKAQHSSIPVKQEEQPWRDDDDEDDVESGHSGCESDKDGDEGKDYDYNNDDEDCPTRKKLLVSDLPDGKTVFIRNLSFETTEEGLEEVLLQFGELIYIRVVLHPDTEHSKGCAFAQFKTKEAADWCIAAARDESEGGGLHVDGRKLNVVLAVSRVEAVKLKDKKVKVQTGTRNLYLAREGMIRAGTKAAEGVPAADLARRARFEELKRVKLRDINVFVSRTRLCIHNLPKSTDSKQLKALCLKAVGREKGGRITECRVMYDRKPEGKQILGRSLGYGFVQFQEHEHALNALRHLNNNPEIFGPLKRPIVEFSLEDGRKLKLKKMHSQKHKHLFKCGVQGVPPSEAGLPLKHGGKALKEVAPRGGATGTQEGGSKPFTGFKTNPEVEEVELPDGKKRRKVLPLPSHRGPKIRERDRGKTQQATPWKTRTRPSRKAQKSAPCSQKPMQPQNQVTKIPKKMVKNKEDQRFDSLVEQYKRRILGNPKRPAIKKSKWFSN
ncbi:hypothetical protein GJAV_G00162570 [Gymnothorax javanicus]|nr:hypothetical protein GJAV_G00162570 [Gymnothorax javanicus]